MGIKGILEEIYFYYMSHRQIGHTTVMMEGAKNSECLILVNDLQQGRELNIPEKRIVSLGSLMRLRGKRQPLVIDHYAIQSIVGLSLKRINALEEENAKLKKGRGSLK
jgi:hypothetical protein